MNDREIAKIVDKIKKQEEAKANAATAVTAILFVALFVAIGDWLKRHLVAAVIFLFLWLPAYAWLWLSHSFLAVAAMLASLCLFGGVMPVTALMGFVIAVVLGIVSIFSPFVGNHFLSLFSAITLIVAAGELIRAADAQDRWILRALLAGVTVIPCFWGVTYDSERMFSLETLCKYASEYRCRDFKKIAETKEREVRAPASSE